MLDPPICADRVRQVRRDLGAGGRRRPGGRPLARRTILVSAYPETRAKINQLAASYGMTVAAYLEQLIDEQAACWMGPGG